MNKETYVNAPYQFKRRRTHKRYVKCVKPMVPSGTIKRENSSGNSSLITHTCLQSREKPKTAFLRQKCGFTPPMDAGCTHCATDAAKAPSFARVRRSGGGWSRRPDGNGGQPAQNCDRVRLLSRRLSKRCVGNSSVQALCRRFVRSTVRWRIRLSKRPLSPRPFQRLCFQRLCDRPSPVRPCQRGLAGLSVPPSMVWVVCASVRAAKHTSIHSKSTP